MRIENFLSSDAFTIVNKKLAKLLWVGRAIYLQELVSQRKRFKQDKFYFTQENMEEELWISYRTQQRYAKELMDFWLITIEKDWIPYKNWYTINDDAVLELLNWQTSSAKMAELGQPKVNIYSYNSKKDTKKISSKEEISEADKLSEADIFLSSLPNTTEKKEKYSAEKERKEYWDSKVNEVIKAIKDECDKLWLAYDKRYDRQFAHHILSWKEYWEFCEKLNQDRITFAVNVLRVSYKIDYFIWPCAWPKMIYQNYSDVFNKSRLWEKKNKESSPAVLDDL